MQTAHDLIVYLGELVGLGFRIGGDDVVREHVKVGDRRHLRSDQERCGKQDPR